MAVVVTYQYPVNGTVPPTVVQALGCNMQLAQITWGDTDTSAILTHNWGIVQPNVASTPVGTPPVYTALAANTVFPIVLPEQGAGSAGTVAPSIAVALTNSNAVTISKLSAAGSNNTLIVTLMRPFSADQ